MHMNVNSAGVNRLGADMAITAIYDPSTPIMLARRGAAGAAAVSRRNQRLRRAHILATVRQLLTEGGYENVTMRKVADVSGHAVQTIYNLVGPRDHAIAEAIGEYTRFVGRTANVNPQDPNAVVEIIACWLQSIAANPEFCRQVSLISFTESRHIFYTFRDRQLKGMQNLLQHQQQCGVLRPDTDTRELGELLVLLSSALCVEWADGNCSLETLQRRLYSGYGRLLANAVVQGREGQSSAAGWNGRPL
jgi:AcrR family transcriptional regulator